MRRTPQGGEDTQSKAMSQGRSARGVPSPSPTSHQLPGSPLPFPQEGTALQLGAAQFPGVSAFSSSEVGAWNRCDAT